MPECRSASAVLRSRGGYRAAQRGRSDRVAGAGGVAERRLRGRTRPPLIARLVLWGVGIVLRLAYGRVAGLPLLWMCCGEVRGARGPHAEPKAAAAGARSAPKLVLVTLNG